MTTIDQPSADEQAAAIERLRAAGEPWIKPIMDRTVSLLDGGSDEGLDQAARIISDLLLLQVLDESDMVYGQFPMRPGASSGDLNACLFLLPYLLDILERHGARLPVELAVRLDAAVRRATVAAQRRWDEEVFDPHRDHKGYTNVFLMYVQGLLLSGLHYDDARLLRMAVGQWKRWFNHTAHTGIDEFVSSTYHDVDYEALRRIHACAPDVQMKRQAQLMLDYFVTLGCAVTHPLLQMAVCGSSRDYRRFLDHPHYEMACVTDAGDGEYQPPAAVKAAYRNRQFPYEASGRATSVPFLFQSWQLEHAALGSATGGNYFWQQIHCIAAAGESAERREVVFLPGAYTITNGFVRQRQGQALCLYAREPNTYLRTQKLRADDQIADAFGNLGVGMTDDWRVDQQDGRLALTAYGHTVTIDPFVIDEGQITPAALSPTRRDNLSQGGRFHDTPVDLQDWLFPDGPRWLGCLVQLTTEGQPAPRPEFTCRLTEDQLQVSAGELAVRLFRNPAGGVVELYEGDPRTLPLLECPEGTLWPGELAAHAIE
ncbi:MAG: hypothetical protein ACYDCO_23010 [Armatimonadota bacterium]